MTGGQLYDTPSSKHRTSARAGAELAEVRRQIAELEAWTQAEKYAGIKNAEDFAHTAAWTRAQPPAIAIPVWQGDLKGRNIVRAIQAAEQSGVSSLSSVSQVDQKWDHMTEEEQDVLLYYVGNGQLEEAGAYLDWLEESVNQREGVRIGQAVRGIDNGLGRTVATGGYGVIAGIDQFAGGVAQAFSDDRRPTSATQYASRYIREDLADSGPQFAGSSIGQTLYDVGTGLGYMAPSILVSALTAGMGAPAAAAGAAGSAAMGLSSYGGAYTQALDEGYSKEQARTYGALVGAGEAVLQYLLGGIGKLGGAVGNKLLSKVAAFDSGLKRAAATMGVRLGSEIGEEELQNHVIEPLLRTLIFGEDFDLPTIEELTQTALVTALTTAVLGTSEMANAGRGNVPTVENSRSNGYNENGETRQNEDEGQGSGHPLPNFDKANINPKKLTSYALNPNHPKGGNKARVFKRALGYDQSNADDLIEQIYEKLSSCTAVSGIADEYGQRYTVDIPIPGQTESL